MGVSKEEVTDGTRPSRKKKLRGAQEKKRKSLEIEATYFFCGRSVR
jgi:hypothetical protein